MPTKPYENRNTTSIKLCKRTGKIIQPTPDVSSSAGDMPGLRRWKNAQPMTKYQILTMKGTVTKSANYDNVTLFSIRPVEMMQLFCKLGDYYRWFKQDNIPMTTAEISNGLNNDVTKCMWIDGVGRRVRIRKQALNAVSRHLAGIKQMDVGGPSWTLRNHLLRVIGEKLDCPLFIDDDDISLPVPVFSSISPANSSQFLLHMMLVLGNISTELELKTKKSMKICLADIGLIPNHHLDSREHLGCYANALLRRVITELFSVYPITMRKMQRYIITAKRLLHSILLDDEIPLGELPPSLLTELLLQKNEEMQSQWNDYISTQLDVMYDSLPKLDSLPKKSDVQSATKKEPIYWDPLQTIPKSEQQTDSSYREQRTALGMGINAVKKYSLQFGVTSQTRGVLTHGNPGSGKSFVLLAQGFYALTQGLRVLPTSLMAKRSNALGGIHLHRLFQLEVNKSAANPRRIAEVSATASLPLIALNLRIKPTCP